MEGIAWGRWVLGLEFWDSVARLQIPSLGSFCSTTMGQSGGGQCGGRMGRVCIHKRPHLFLLVLGRLCQGKCGSSHIIHHWLQKAGPDQ